MTELDEANQTMSPKLMKNISKIFSGSLIQAESGTQFKDDLTHLHHSARHQNKTRSCQQVQSLSEDGVLTVKNANHHIQERKQKEEAKAEQQASKRFRNISTQQGATRENRVPDENLILGDDGNVIAWFDK